MHFTSQGSFQITDEGENTQDTSDILARLKAGESIEAVWRDAEIRGVAHSDYRIMLMQARRKIFT